MSKNIMLIPVREKVGLISVTMGMARNFEQHGVNYGFFSPISVTDQSEREYRLINEGATETPSIPFEKVAASMTNNNMAALLQEIVKLHSPLVDRHDVVLIKGMTPSIRYPFIESLNAAIARALNARIVLVAMPDNDISNLNATLEIAMNAYGGPRNSSVYGCIVNKVGAPVDTDGIARLDLEAVPDTAELHEQVKALPVFAQSKLKLLGSIDWNKQLYSPRIQDIITKLDATVLYQGDMEKRRVSYLKLCARSVNTVLYVLVSNTLIITAGDRADIVIAASLAELRGIKVSAIILTGCYDIRPEVMDFCKVAFDSGLTVLSVPTDSYQTASLLKNIDTSIPLDDKTRIELVKDTLAHIIDTQDLIKNINKGDELYITPPAFMYRLLKKAKSIKKRIVLPEGLDERVVMAANESVKKGIVECVLFAKKDELESVAKSHNIQLHSDLIVIDPDTLRERYVLALCEVRKHKQMTEEIATEWLKDDIVLATMMLHQGDVDGLVAGAVRSTASTIRPALQIIKTKPSISKVSSLFFMCMPGSVLVFADCAINPNPSADELADIAIMASNTAEDFGIKPRVAMLSYSTGSSGAGTDVEKVVEATKKVKERHSELLLDGPLQYDAAINPNVAQLKAPNSPVAGQASVLVFPDLNTGNTTYKAVQRSANIVCVGPVLLGLNRPVNDLSRGCSVKDVMYTIAITAIQAQRD